MTKTRRTTTVGSLPGSGDGVASLASLTIADRVEAFKRAYAQWPASWPWLVQEQGRVVLYATWLLGNDYRNKTAFYGAYPPGFLARVLALFPDATDERRVLHAFSGSLPMGPYRRCDVKAWPNTSGGPEFLSSVYSLPSLVTSPFELILADPPYSAADAAHYESGMVDRRRGIAALAQVTRVGGHLVWLDTVWPMHRKREWQTVGRITIVRSTNHRIRMATIFERAA